MFLLIYLSADTLRSWGRDQSKQTPYRTHLQPAYEEDELEDKDDGEEHLSIVCVQLLASNQREPKVKVGCHNYNLNV